MKHDSVLKLPTRYGYHTVFRPLRCLRALCGPYQAEVLSISNSMVAFQVYWLSCLHFGWFHSVYVTEIQLLLQMSGKGSKIVPQQKFRRMHKVTDSYKHQKHFFSFCVYSRFFPYSPYTFLSVPTSRDNVVNHCGFLSHQRHIFLQH